MSYKLITENGQIRMIPVDNSILQESVSSLCEVGTRFLFRNGRMFRTIPVIML